jgi:hypothetical protein
VPGLPSEVVSRIVAELGARGVKVADCLRTAAALVSQAREDDGGLRLAESAAYNLREALDAVVDGRPAPRGGLGSVGEALTRYRAALRGPAADVEAARAELDGVLERLGRDEEWHGFKAQRLLEYVRDQTGVEPLPGEDSPTQSYSKLRERANTTLHTAGDVSGVAALYDDAIAWFSRFFTPPDSRVQALAALAERPYADDLIEEVRQLALNPHHLRLLFSRLRDPAWLDPLYEAYIPGSDDAPDSSVGRVPVYVKSTRCNDVNLRVTGGGVPGLAARVYFLPYEDGYECNPWTQIPVGDTNWRVIASNVIPGTRFEVEFTNTGDYLTGFIAY